MKNNAEYTKDFYAWALDSARLIRQKKFSEIDIRAYCGGNREHREK